MKKIVTILLAVMCLFTLAACNNGGGSSEGGESGTSEKASIKVGGSGPLTGGAALYGMAVNRGAQIAVDEINERKQYLPDVLYRFQPGNRFC